MKILWFYSYNKLFNFDHWLHLDFAKAISNYPGIELKVYGYNLELTNHSDISIPYNSNKTMQDLKQEFNYDIVILNTKSRMFLYYLPPYNGIEVRKDCWLPKDFADWEKTPKIMIEEDYHWEKNDDWYVEMGINCILQRHYSQSLRQQRVKMIWLPFSTDNEIFKPNLDIERIKRICFIGNNNEDIYPRRYKISNLLESLNFLTIEGTSQKRKYDKDYITCLQNYVSHLNSSSIVDITSAKMFEIMSSGSLLFTNNSKKYGLQELFPRDTYCTYKENYSDVLSKTQLILNEPQYVKETTQKALQCIKEKHTHKIRIKQLLDIIHGEFNLEEN